MFRRRRQEPAAADRLGARWQHFVDAAESVRADFTSLVDRSPAGPLRLRLDEMAGALGRQVDEVREIATDSERLDDAVQRLDPDAVTAAYKHARRAATDESAADRVASLGTQHATVQRMLNTVDATEQRLDLAIVRLRELLVRGTEIVLARNHGAADELDHDLASVGVELAALHAALAECDATG